MWCCVGLARMVVRMFERTLFRCWRTLVLLIELMLVGEQLRLVCQL